MGCGLSSNCTSSQQESNVVQSSSSPKKYNNNVLEIFQPEPRQTANVVVYDLEGYLYRLHSGFLQYTSIVFQRIDLARPVYFEYSRTVTLTVLQMIYNEQHYTTLLNKITIDQLLDVWKCCFEYKFTACALACVDMLVKLLPNITSIDLLVAICNATYYFQADQLKSDVIARLANFRWINEETPLLKSLHEIAKIDLIVFQSTTSSPPHVRM